MTVSEETGMQPIATNCKMVLVKHKQSEIFATVAAASVAYDDVAASDDADDVVPYDDTAADDVSYDAVVILLMMLMLLPFDATTISLM